MSKLATRTIASRPEDDPAHPARRRRGLAQAWADRSLRLKGLVVVAIPLLTLVFLAPVYSWSQGKAQNASALVIHTLEVRSEIERVQNLYQDTSLRTRGYLLTGSKDFLTPYEASVSARQSLTQ